jgi:hypothetical protein
LRHVAQGVDDALDAGVVGCDAVADQAVGGRQLLEQVDRHVEGLLGLEQDVGGVDAGGAGSDDGQSKGGHELSLSWWAARRCRPC